MTQKQGIPNYEITMEDSMQRKMNTMNNTLNRKRRKGNKTYKKEVLEKVVPIRPTGAGRMT